MKSNISFVYFGGEPLGAPVLEALCTTGLIPSLVVCNPDRPVGRKQVLTPPPVKLIATQYQIPVLQPDALTEAAVAEITAAPADLFVVVAYNHILPTAILEHPAHGTVNLHPSLLPLLRGASPIRSAILRDMRDEVGVSIMLLDMKMDHGPILAQEIVPMDATTWPIRGNELDQLLTQVGSQLLVTTIPEWVRGAIEPQEQDHNAATYCGRFTRADGELDIDPTKLPRGTAAWQALLKIRAFDGFPGTFFIYHGVRIKIVDGDIIDDQLTIHAVVPEGKREQPFTAWLQTVVR